MPAPKPKTLPPNLPPAGLNEAQAAAFVGATLAAFKRAVAKGQLPRPLNVDGDRVWSVEALRTWLFPTRSAHHLPIEQDDIAERI